MISERGLLIATSAWPRSISRDPVRSRDDVHQYGNCAQRAVIRFDAMADPLVAIPTFVDDVQYTGRPKLSSNIRLTVALSPTVQLRDDDV